MQDMGQHDVDETSTEEGLLSEVWQFALDTYLDRSLPGYQRYRGWVLAGAVLKRRAVLNAEFESRLLAELRNAKEK